jgi:hypothetical protein
MRSVLPSGDDNIHNSAESFDDSVARDIRVRVMFDMFTLLAITSLPTSSRSKDTTPFHDIFRIVTKFPPPVAVNTPNS